MTKHWLLKSEPESWSWDQQVAQGEAGEGWDGVRNYQASNFMKQMKVGDLCFFYHSGKSREIVGIVEVCKTYHPDPTDTKGRFGMVRVKAVQPLKKPVSLTAIKARDDLQDLPLIRQSRLSVMPISSEAWFQIIEMSK
ncbi:MAG: EVE domain-containing protein [Alphaproteobacteria bacterium]|nr:EVE domain-containing protein [Alphaproteobacteria bacterium]